MAKSLLIVGGTGFIGKKLTLYALTYGYIITVLCLNNLSDEQKINEVTYIQVDITQIDQLKNKLIDTAFDYVVNLSGYIDHSPLLEGGCHVLETHFDGLKNLLQTLDWNKLSRFVQIGSSDEYGIQSAPQNENMRESPISPYSLAKVAATHLLQMLHRTQGLPTVILRFFLVYGPMQNNHRFLPQIIQGCLSNENFATSAGQQLRDFCYIDDITRGIVMSLENSDANGQVINLASGTAITIREVIERVQVLISKGQPLYGKIPYREGENMSLYADITKASTLLQWSPEINLTEGLLQTVDFYQKAYRNV